MGALIPTMGWPSLFYIAGATGVILSVVGVIARRIMLRSDSMSTTTMPTTRHSAASKYEELRTLLSWPVVGQLACMIYVHSVINVCFFVFQNWLPKYMVMDLHLDISKSAYLTALPWIVLAVCTMTAGHLSDCMLDLGWSALHVRQIMVGVSTLVPALCLLCLGGIIQEPLAAIAILVIALAGHGFNNAGYHSHVNDVAPEKAGFIIGLTNTVGVVAGIGMQLVVAYVVEKTGSFRIVFNLTAMLYISGFACFCMFMQGGPLLRSGEEEKLRTRTSESV